MIIDTNYCLDINGEGIQSFGRDGIVEGTLRNRHLIPIQYAEKKDMLNHPIYEGDIIKRENGAPGEKDLIGVVEFLECAWWIINYRECRLERLFDEIAIDIILGNKWENPELLKKLNIREEV